MPSDLLCLCVSMIMMKCELILWLWSPYLVLGWLMLQSAGKNCAKACYSATLKLSVLFCTRIRARGRWRSFSIEQQTREAIGFVAHLVYSTSLAFLDDFSVIYCALGNCGTNLAIFCVDCVDVAATKFRNWSWWTSAWNRYLKLASKVLPCLSIGCYLLLIASSAVYNQHDEW